MGKRKTIIPKDSKVNLPVPKNEKQKKLIDAILHKDLILAVGDAGTGKTFISTCLAAYMFSHDKVKKIVITRPTVPTGKSIGFFPGTLEEKMEPWVKPFMDVLVEILGKGKVDCMLKNDQIEIVPFEVIRGRSFNNCFVILDEGQNASYLEIKAFVTRHGENTTTVVNGDITQSDLNGSGNGLEILLGLLEKNEESAGQNLYSVVQFNGKNDSVRSELCTFMINTFKEHENNEKTTAKNSNSCQSRTSQSGKSQASAKVFKSN